MTETMTQTKIQTILATNIKKMRRDRNMTQAALAKKAGTVGNYIALIENAARFPSAEMVERLAEALEVESTELFRPSAENFGNTSNPWNWVS
jgi:transcriptional regulator with XRE-family HTH domain